jgi:CheY-like chemotaxis protein
MGRYHTVCAKDGEEALSIARIDVPDIILLDINLPGLNGYQVCRLVKADPGMSETKVIMITGMAQSYDQSKAREAGADGYFTKPFSSAALAKKVGTLLESR